jgi:uncharacterized RDD family membrane protein YckC
MQGYQADTISLQSGDVLDLKLEIAGTGARSHAFVIDWHIRFIAAVAWIFLAGWLLLGFDSSWFKDTDDEQLRWTLGVVFLPSSLIYLLYHPVLEILMRGRTPGKNMTGIRITTETGQTPGIGALLIRNIFRIVDSLPTMYLLGLLMTLITKKSVRIGDIAAGTLLVYEERVKANALADATDLALNSSLSPANQTLLLEVLERWKDMEPEKRAAIGMKFLRSIGVSVPDSLTPQFMDTFVHDKLKSLLGNR